MLSRPCQISIKSIACLPDIDSDVAVAGQAPILVVFTMFASRITRHRTSHQVKSVPARKR